MKEYLIRKPQCTYNLDLCDMLANAMMKESFRLTRIKTGGRFYFEYNLPAREMRCFSCITITGRPFGRHMKELLEELNRIYEASEVLSIGTRLVIYTFEPKSKKSQEYLNSCARMYGLDSFTHDTYLDALAKRRNTILKKSYIVLAVIFACFSAMFLIFGIVSLWYCYIPAGLMLLLSLFNLIRGLSF